MASPSQGSSSSRSSRGAARGLRRLQRRDRHRAPVLDGFRAADGSFPPYGSVDAAGRKQISDTFAKVAETAAALNPAIGLD